MNRSFYETASSLLPGILLLKYYYLLERDKTCLLLFEYMNFIKSKIEILQYQKAISEGAISVGWAISVGRRWKQFISEEIAYANTDVCYF